MERGADVKGGALHVAVAEGLLPSAALLLDKGADPNVPWGMKSSLCISQG